MQISSNTTPKEGTELHVMTASLPTLGSQIEIIKGKHAVAVGIVTEHTSNATYKVLVVMSEAN